MVCDGEGRNSFDGVYPILPNTYGAVNESGYFYSEFYQCSYTDGSDRTNAEAFLPGFTNAVSKSDYDGTGYSYANYLHTKMQMDLIQMLMLTFYGQIFQILKIRWTKQPNHLKRM